MRCVKKIFPNIAITIELFKHCFQTAAMTNNRRKLLEYLRNYVFSKFSSLY